MRVLSWLTCLWPGLPRLWLRGETRGLMAAISFALAVNGWLVCRFLWLGIAPGGVLTAGGMMLVAVWLASVWQGWRNLREIRDGSGDHAPEGLFVQAQREYLHRHWVEAEHLLRDLTRQHPRDVEAQLMLATLYRHTGRAAEAAATLENLSRLDGAGRWGLEMATERRLLPPESTRENEGEAPPAAPPESRPQRREPEGREGVRTAGVRPTLASTG